MDVQYYVGEKEVRWDTLTLEEYNKNYCPPGWEEMFDVARDDIIPAISKKLYNYSKTNIIYPPMPFVYNAMDSLRPEKVKVVIIGQDPYINEGEAMGWSFSVPNKIPPSLRNIFKELHDEGYKGYKDRKIGNLEDWVEKGVFLYNVCLTVNKGESGSHKDVWNDFTDLVINYLNRYDNIAWILLGAQAQKYAKIIDKQRHGVYIAGHPSPLNRSGGFMGSCIFEEAEEYLEKHCRKFSWD